MAQKVAASLWSSRRGHGNGIDTTGSPEGPVTEPDGSFGRFFVLGVRGLYRHDLGTPRAEAVTRDQAVLDEGRSTVADLRRDVSELQRVGVDVPAPACVHARVAAHDEPVRDR